MSQAQTTAEPWRQNLRGEHDAPLRGPRAAWWWTGLPPERCPGRQPDGTLTALPAPNLATCTRQSVQAAFDNGWALTELLFASLQGEEAFYRPPYHHLRHPMIFYYCHPAALYINKLRVAIRIRKRNDIAANMRVVQGAHLFNIQSIVPDVDGNPYIDLICEVLDV